MTNIIKHIYYLILIIVITPDFYSQVFIPTNFTPNTGSKINDITNVYANDINEQTYLIAGNFISTLLNNSSNGLAFIRKDNYNETIPTRFSAILSANFTQGAFGSQITELKTVEYYKTIVNNGGNSDTIENIYIGGTFQEVNGLTRVGLCLFKSVNHNNFTLDNWSPDFGVGANFNVNGCVIKNDSLFISGYFDYSESGLYDPNGLNSITAFTLPNNGTTNYGQSAIFQQYFGYSNSYTNSQSSPIRIDLVDNQLLAYSSYYSFLISNSIFKLAPSGGGNGTLYNFFGVNDFTDSTFLINYSSSISGSIHLPTAGTRVNEIRKTDGTAIDTIYNPSSPNPMPEPKFKFYDTPNYRNGSTSTPYFNNMTRYKDDIYFFGNLFTSNSSTTSNSNRKIWKRNINNDLDTSFASFTTNNTSFPNTQSYLFENKLLYVTNVDSINHNKINGLAVFCLEPMDVESLSDFDTTVCAGQDSILYAVDSVGFATSFKWEYNGTGMLIYQNSGTQPLDTLTPTSSHITGDSVYVKFGPNFTPGTLTVNALSECGVPSKPYSINIISNPLPQVYAGLDTTLNCKRDSVILIGSSTTSNVTFKWNPFSFPSTIGTNNTVSINGEYIFEVRDSIGCANYDTVSVTMDTVAPIAAPITAPNFITCSILSRTFNGSSNASASTDSLYWKFNGSYFNNPIIASTPNGTYNLIALNKINGCVDSSQFMILNDSSTPPNLSIQGYTTISPLVALETITCTNDTLNLTTESSTPNTVTNWTSVDSLQLYGSQLEIAEAGTYYITATNTDNGCEIYKTLLIDVDTAKPIALIFPNQLTELSCSLDSLFLIGGSPTSSTNSYWSGPNNYATSNPAIIITPGTYQINVNSIINGCTNTDSINVEYNPTILVSLGNDTVACYQENITINSSSIGNSITGLSYSWNNGSTSTSSSYIAGTDSLIILELTGDNSCYGTDTLVLTTPPNPEVSITSFKPCGAGNDGQIVVAPTSGWTPFNYSIDNGGSFQNTGVFNNLAYGTYPLLVRDSLGCAYNFSTTINDNSNLPTPLFLVQTYNFSSDTVILVDVSSPPTDSSSWAFPSGIQIIDNSSLAPVIILPDTGSFEVTMRGYYGNCNVDITKTIYAIDYDSTFATSSNANGIKTMQLYPNPNTGNFNIEIEFYKKQQAVITVQDISGNSFFYNQYGEVNTINEYISLSNAINGTYILKIVSEFDSRYITFIVTQ